MTTCPSPWYTASTEKECLHKDLKYTETFSILYLGATVLTCVCVCVCVYECAGTCLCVTRLSYNKVAAHRWKNFCTTVPDQIKIVNRCRPKKNWQFWQHPLTRWFNNKIYWQILRTSIPLWSMKIHPPTQWTHHFYHGESKHHNMCLHRNSKSMFWNRTCWLNK